MIVQDSNLFKKERAHALVNTVAVCGSQGSKLSVGSDTNKEDTIISVIMNLHSEMLY